MSGSTATAVESESAGLSARSDLDVLIEEEGGPITLTRQAPTRHKWAMYDACSALPFAKFEGIFAEFAVDRSTARRHWPWTALAVWNYACDRSNVTEEKSRLMKPSEVVAKLDRVAKLAEQLNAELFGLERLGALIAQPLRAREHSVTLWRLLMHAWQSYRARPWQADVRPMSDFYPDQMTAARECGLAFLDMTGTLECLGRATAFVKDQVDQEALRGKGGGADPALPYFVEAASIIWESATGRVARVNKLSRVATDVPDFIRFVQSVIGSVRDPVPTPSQVRTAYRALSSAEKNVGTGGWTPKRT